MDHGDLQGEMGEGVNKKKNRMMGEKSERQGQYEMNKNKFNNEKMAG